MAGSTEAIGALYIHPTALVDEGAHIGAGSKVWHFSHVMAGAQVGERCVIGQNCYIAGEARLGAGVKLQNNVSVYDGVILEDDVFCGPSVVFTNVMNPRAFVNRRAEYRSTRVGLGASLGANATLVCGISLGKYCMVGAGSVVLKDVPAFGLVVGVPARLVGWVSRVGERLSFDARGFAACPATGERYRLSADGEACEEILPGGNMKALAREGDDDDK